MSKKYVEIDKLSVNQLKCLIRMLEEIKQEMIKSNDSLEQINNLLEKYNQEIDSRGSVVV